MDLGTLRENGTEKRKLERRSHTTRFLQCEDEFGQLPRSTLGLFRTMYLGVEDHELFLRDEGKTRSLSRQSPGNTCSKREGSYQKETFRGTNKEVDWVHESTVEKVLQKRSMRRELYCHPLPYLVTYSFISPVISAIHRVFSKPSQTPLDYVYTPLIPRTYPEPPIPSLPTPLRLPNLPRLPVRTPDLTS